ncbi:nucleotidyltransferase domain-containing protein [Shewanella eurypsychrophilus]|uniref:Nucleotidyltransferase domain-containing protein n=1 Tax=Shewanella eurypsychrophilus TaxID=2593656 RepID=A0ABX6V1U6_9GAMM|nr:MULTISPECIES: nucleotidyltransferase domain-containing protein [Shewanella]QPG56260.2 nucleotidyltransferase domain-containing protein [Shewanella eurypsychrophilus]
MKINSTDTIANFPALKARKIIRGLSRNHEGFNISTLRSVIGTTKKVTQSHLNSFISEGYIEAIDPPSKDRTHITTIKGNSLAQATASKKVKRSTANKHYEEFMERVNEINSSDKYLFQVSEVILFGSYLTDAPTVSDIDLYIRVERKPKFSDNFSSIREQRTLEMERDGRQFRTFSELIYWPETDVRKYLKNGSRVISIQACMPDPDDIPEGNKTVFNIHSH